MTKHEQVANIIAFLSILFGESGEFWTIMEFSPDYIIEKFNRYIESSRVEYAWGMHRALKNRVFKSYVDKWKLELKDDE